MINNDRIVTIQKIDFLSLNGTVLALNNTSYTAIAATDVEGDFEVTGSGAAGNKLASQPVKSLDFKSGVTSGTVYFVAAYDYEGFKVAGTAVTPAAGSVTVKADGITLYKAVLADSAVTITAVTPVVA